MVDIVSPEKRSAMMAAVRGKDTKPEWVVRRMLHRRGFRYRLHQKRLPGAPDLVFAARQTVIFVHGCFWHGHAGCRYATLPETRRNFWAEKIAANRARDRRKEASLEESGWKVLVVWECETRKPDELLVRLLQHLRKPNRKIELPACKTLGQRRS